jgi:hypothetical protein
VRSSVMALTSNDEFSCQRTRPGTYERRSEHSFFIVTQRYSKTPRANVITVRTQKEVSGSVLRQPSAEELC